MVSIFSKVIFFVIISQSFCGCCKRRGKNNDNQTKLLNGKPSSLGIPKNPDKGGFKIPKNLDKGGFKIPKNLDKGGFEIPKNLDKGGSSIYRKPVINTEIPLKNEAGINNYGPIYNYLRYVSSYFDRILPENLTVSLLKKTVSKYFNFCEHRLVLRFFKDETIIEGIGDDTMINNLDYNRFEIAFNNDSNDCCGKDICMYEIEYKMDGADNAKKEYEEAKLAFENEKVKLEAAKLQKIMENKEKKYISALNVVRKTENKKEIEPLPLDVYSPSIFEPIKNYFSNLFDKRERCFFTKDHHVINGVENDIKTVIDLLENKVIYAETVNEKYKINMNIKTLTGKDINIEADPFSHIFHLKEKFRRKEGNPIKTQRLINQGKKLDDSKVLFDYGIITDATLHNVFRSNY